MLHVVAQGKAILADVGDFQSLSLDIKNIAFEW